VGFAIVGLTALVGLVAPLFVTADPVAMNFSELLKGPSHAHLLGTDQFGRDVLARLVWGARLSVSIGAVAVALALVVGVPIGGLSGYAGGAVDNVLMRCMDALLAFPALLLALGLVAIMGPGSISTTLAIGIVYTPGVARLTRGVVLAERPQEYVQAAHALGQRDRWVLMRHIMPNCVSALLVQASVNFANAMVIEAGLSFLGIGTPPPTPSWGLMLNEARAFMSSAAHVAIAPGVAISLAVLGWNLLGDGLRDALDPRLTE
jgi:ABC-type dipeptide/oligopeptide/nickel transport system permease subunit